MIKKIVLLIVLLAASAQAGNLTLRWTATGDDSTNGQAARYDMRVAVSTYFIENNFDSCNRVDNLPLPSPSGQPDSVCIDLSGLPAGLNLYFAIKAIDEAGNVGALSNILTVFIEAPDLTCPGRIGDLRFNINR